MTALVLLSGGIDSTAIAAWLPFDGALTIDYGQKPAGGEINAAAAVATSLDLPHEVITVDASAVGSGLLTGTEPLAVSPAAEWWPYRNQLLVTIAAAYAIGKGYDTVAVGTVAGDSARHNDGTPQFYEKLNELLAIQEGGISVATPAAHLTALELLQKARPSAELLAWSHSCHRAALACGDCPGCWKRAELLDAYQPA